MSGARRPDAGPPTPWRARQVQDATYRISEATLAAETLQDLLRALHGIVGELMPAQNFYVALVDAERQRLTFPYFVDEYDDDSAPKPLGRGLTEYVLRTGESLLATEEVHDDLIRRGEAELIGPPSLCWVGVPLKVRDRTIGVIVVQTYSQGIRYDDADKQILQFVATQVALAVERKRAEDALRQQSELLQRIVDHIPVMLATVEPGGRITWGNRAWSRMLGYTVADALARDILAEMYPDAAERQRVYRSIGTPAGQWNDFRTTLPDGRVLDTSWTNVALPGGGYLAIGLDVTERRRAETALHEAAEQLRQAQKMEAVGRLAGGVAHDFNNLLTAILGSTHLLLAGLAPGDPLREDAQEVKNAAERAAALTRQLLAYSRRQVLRPEPLSLNTVVAEMHRLLRRLIGEDVELVTVLAPDLGTARADPGQIEQVIVNLALNARDAMPRGGRLVLETANADLDAAWVAGHRGATAGAHVMLAVTDTGTGMDAETTAHLFEPFFTTKEVGKGTGLGLATVYGIVKQSGGYIAVSSEPGRGSSFQIYLPRVDRPAAPARAREPAPAPHRGSETILVVEDEAAVRSLSRRVLEAHGYTVLATAGGAEALQLSAGHPGQIHLLVTDVVMPGMNGRELAERLAALRPGLRVLYMSGYPGESIVNRGALDPARAFLQKPFTPEALSRKVREVLDAP